MTKYTKVWYISKYNEQQEVIKELDSKVEVRELELEVLHKEHASNLDSRLAFENENSFFTKINNDLIKDVLNLSIWKIKVPELLWFIGRYKLWINHCVNLKSLQDNIKDDIGFILPKVTYNVIDVDDVDDKETTSK